VLPDFIQRFANRFLLPVGYIGRFLFHDLDGLLFLEMLDEGGGIILFDVSS
jgi:hypothetical protein